jgi:hypothetical protein
MYENVMIFLTNGNVSQQVNEWKIKANEAQTAKRQAEASKTKLEQQLTVWKVFECCFFVPNIPHQVHIRLGSSQSVSEELGRLQAQKAIIEREVATIEAKVNARVEKAQVCPVFFLASMFCVLWLVHDMFLNGFLYHQVEFDEKLAANQRALEDVQSQRNHAIKRSGTLAKDLGLKYDFSFFFFLYFQTCLTTNLSIVMLLWLQSVVCV